MHDAARLWSRFIERHVQRDFLGRRVARNVLAVGVQLGQPRRFEEAQAGIGRRDEEAVVEPCREIAR